MSLTNPYGDFEISDPKAMRALAHPVRLAALTHLQRHGPSTATQLAEVVGATPSVTSWHLRHLAEFGLVSDWDGGTDARQRWWQATAQGIRLEMPADESGMSDFNALSAQMGAMAVNQAAAWMTEVAPTLDASWMAVSDVSNTLLLATREEAAALTSQIEQLLLPLLASKREPAEAGEGAEAVRFVRFLMPQPEEPL